MVIAIAQEDDSMASHCKIYDKLKPQPRFPIAPDFGRRHTERYHRTAAYLIDQEGVVQQVFPMIIHARPTWHAILNEIDRMQAEEAK